MQTVAAASPPQPPSPSSIVDRALRVFADVRPGEGVTALLLLTNVFLLLTAYYLVKVAREPLILSIQGGAELKSYAALGQSLLLLPLTKAYALLSERVRRITLIVATTLFFVGNIAIFLLSARAGLNIAIPFFLWVGVFNYVIVAQFWSFAADIYTEEQGRRLFPILGVGSSLGAVLGAAVARRLVSLGPQALLFASGLILAGCTLFPRAVEARQMADAPREHQVATREPLGKEGGWELLLADPYLLALGGLSLVVNATNSMGEYALDKTLVATVVQGAGAMQTIGAFKADYLFWINVLSVTLQVFVVSRVVKLVGIRRALFVMPLVSLLGYAGAALVPMLGVFAIVKIAENGLDYSLGNTVRNALWLVTSREAKYKTKAIVDTFLVRAGDVLSAAAVAGGAALHLTPRMFAALNVVTASAWVGLVTILARHHVRRAP